MIHRIFTIAFFLVLIGSWEVASRSGLWSPVLLPSPLNVLEYMWQATMDGTLVTSTLVTMKRLLLGYGIGQAMAAAFSSDLYRVPFVVGRDVYATAR
jgi:NitT/TauT family transport system permease protein